MIQMGKIKSFVKRHAQTVKTAAVGFLTTIAAAVVTVPAWASGITQTVVTSSDWQSVIDALTKQISVSSIVAVLASAVALSIGFVFMWWGVRKVIQVFFSGARGGRTNV